uniref:porin n=1 Tax=Thauera sp. SDU_THAU2 TaxID=3136633 RepID=UPI00311EA0D6
MQKKLIALAIAGLVSAPIFAQSNVTIYGVADAFVGIGKHGENDFRGVNSGGLSGSRLGFRGTEDLGNGLKAVFVLEQGFNIDTGEQALMGGNSDNSDIDPDNDRYNDSFSRQAYVGLSGAFGTVALGRQYAPGFFFAYDGTAAATVGPHSILSGQSGMTITPNSAARWNNSVTYTGSFSGLTARVIYSAQGVETSEKPSDDDAYGLGLEYANGPLKVGGVYQVVKNDNDAVGSDEKQKEWGLGSSRLMHNLVNDPAS